MSRRTLAALVVGWLLGIVTALVTPSLVWQRRTTEGPLNTREALATGDWYIIRQDDRFFTLERPRFRLP